MSGDTNFESEVVCPHCGYRHRDSWEMEEGVRDCAECDKPFEMFRDVSVTYSTIKIEVTNE